MIPNIFHSIFEENLIRDIQSSSKLINVNEGELIVNFGQIIQFIPLLIKGSIKVSRLDENGKELLLYYVNPNESCAMTFTCCMQKFPSQIKATADTNVDFLSIPISMMDEWMIKYPSWKTFVMNTIRIRFNELLHTIDLLAFQKLDERLINYLKEKQKATGTSVVSLSHEQIASEMGTSREVISRLLKKLENDGKVVLYRNQLKILSSL